MKVFDGRRVVVVELIGQEAGDDGRFADARRPQQHQAVTVFRRGALPLDEDGHGARPGGALHSHVLAGVRSVVQWEGIHTTGTARHTLWSVSVASLLLGRFNVNVVRAVLVRCHR